MFMPQFFSFLKEKSTGNFGHGEGSKFEGEIPVSEKLLC